MNVLLVWDNTEIGVDFYLIDDPSTDELNVLMAADGEFINSGDDYSNNVFFVSSAITEEGIYCEEKEWAHKWVYKKVNTPISKKIDLVIHCGICG